MPIMTDQDSNGWFVKWGGKGKKYYFKLGNKASHENAKLKAQKQAKAAYANGYKKQ